MPGGGGLYFPSPRYTCLWHGAQTRRLPHIYLWVCSSYFNFFRVTNNIYNSDNVLFLYKGLICIAWHCQWWNPMNILDCGFLGYGIMYEYFCRCSTTFLTHLMSPSSNITEDGGGNLLRNVRDHLSDNTRYNNSKDHNRNLHCHENLKPHKYVGILINHFRASCFFHFSHPRTHPLVWNLSSAHLLALFEVTWHLL
jgi:hypothetical protein